MHATKNIKASLNTHLNITNIFNHKKDNLQINTGQLMKFTCFSHFYYATWSLWSQFYLKKKWENRVLICDRFFAFAFFFLLLSTYLIGLKTQDTKQL